MLLADRGRPPMEPRPQASREESPLAVKNSRNGSLCLGRPPRENRRDEDHTLVTRTRSVPLASFSVPAVPFWKRTLTALFALTYAVRVVPCKSTENDASACSPGAAP